MKTISGIEFASEHNGTDVFRLIELAYEQGQKDGHSEQLGTNLAEVGTDLISRAAAITLPVTPKEHREYQTYNLDDVYEQGGSICKSALKSCRLHSQNIQGSGFIRKG